MKSYKDLEIYQKAFQLAVKVHEMSLALPKYEMFEIGAQVRRASQSVKDNIVEGYGRREYKKDFLKFLLYAHASLLETLSQLEMLRKLYGGDEMDVLIKDYDSLGVKIHRFREYVKKEWRE